MAAALVSDAEIAYIAGGILDGVRSDGRGCYDFRPCEVELDVVAQAAGSARVRLGTTDVLVAVRVDLVSPDPSAPDRGLVSVSVECSSTASPEYKGRGGEGWGSEMAAALAAALAPPPSAAAAAAGAAGAAATAGGSAAANGSPPSTTATTTTTTTWGLDTRALCVLPGRTAWRLCVDGLLLNDGGAALSALSLAARCALAAARLPRVTVAAAAEGDDEGGGDGGDDGEPEVEIDDDLAAAVRLDAARVPLIVTVAEVRPRGAGGSAAAYRDEMDDDEEGQEGGLRAGGGGDGGGGAAAPATAGARLLLDPDAGEEAAAAAQLHVAVVVASSSSLASGGGGGGAFVAGATKEGGGALHPSALAEALEVACRAGARLAAAQDAFLRGAGVLEGGAGGGGGLGRGGGGAMATT